MTKVDSKITYLGIAVAFDCLFRISEYGLVWGSNHMIRSKDVAFEVISLAAPVQPGELRQALSVRGRSARSVQLHIPEYRSKVFRSDRNVRLNCRGPTSAYSTELIVDFTEFCVRERRICNAPLFSRTRNGRTKLLNHDMVANGMKDLRTKATKTLFCAFEEKKSTSRD